MIISGRLAKLLLAALGLSLALNLFVAGVLLGQALHAPQRGGESGLQGLARLVPAGARPIIKERLREHEAELDDRLRELRATRRDAFALLRADPFDPEATRAAFARLREQSTAVQAMIQELLVETALRTPPEIRAAWDHRRVGPDR